MLLRHVGEQTAAAAVEAAVRVVLGQRRALTPDLGGTATTDDVASNVIIALQEADEALAVRG